MPSYWLLLSSKAAHPPTQSPVSRRLLKGIAVLWTFIWALELVAIGYGHQHPAPDDGSGRDLAHCGAVPCFRNMIPGRTPWTLVRTTFAQSSINQVYDRKIIVALGSDGSASLYPSSNSAMLGLISVQVPSAAVSLGDIVEQYGPPCGISVDPSAGAQLEMLDYPLLAITVHVLDGHLRLDTPVTGFALLDPAMTAAEHLDSCKGVYAGTVPQTASEPWHGFASAWHYLKDK